MTDQNQTETSPQSETNSPSGTTDTEHLDAIVVEDDPGQEEAAAPDMGPPTNDSGFIDKEFWIEGLKGTFGLLTDVTGLQTFRHSTKLPTADPAMEAVYDTCCEVPALNFMVHPSSKWFQRAAAIGAFALPVYIGVQHEIAARRAKDVTPAEPAAAAEPKEQPPQDGAKL